MRAITQGAATGYAFDAAVWLQERQAILITGVTLVTGETWNSTYVVLKNDNADEIARYALTVDRTAAIDVSDYIRTHYTLGDTEYLRIYVYYGNSKTWASSYARLDYVACGLIAPERLGVPPVRDTMEYAAAQSVTGAGVFAPPHKIVAAEDGALVVYSNKLAGYLALSTTMQVDVWGVGEVRYVPVVTAVVSGSVLNDLIIETMQAVYGDYLHVVQTVQDADYDVNYEHGDSEVRMFFRNIAGLTTAAANRITADVLAFIVENMQAEGAEKSYRSEIGVALRGLENTTVQAGQISAAKPNAIMIGSAVRSFAIVTAAGMSDPFVLRHVTPQECPREYVRVSWLGAWGIPDEQDPLKCAMWEKTAQTISTENEVVLLPEAGQNFAQIKGRGEEITLVLRGLTRFDVWYYADIVTSSRVYVERNGEEVAVHVDSSEVVVPDGNGVLTDLKVKLTVVNYDAVAM